MKFKHLDKVLFLIFAGSVLIEDVSWAQSRKTRPAGIGSLLEMKCYGAGLNADKEDGIVINRRPYTSIGTFNSQGGYYILKERPIEASCELAARNQSPIYKTLIMTVGSNEQSDFWTNNYSARSRITVYIDGEFAGSNEVGFRELKRFSLNINGSRSVAFSVECLQSKRTETCPALSILEDKLIQ